MSTLKEKTYAGVSWSVIERFSVQGVNFLLQIILARLLMPEDFGVIAIISVFIQFSQVLIDSGFASALVQKQNCSEDDCSTVFFCNLFISLFLYIVLFFSAPLIADFYDLPNLPPLLRVISLSLLFNALTIVQRTRLVKNIDFKSISKATFVSALASGLLGVLFAYIGLGVWSLVLQTVVNSILLFTFFHFYSHWRLSGVFSVESFKELFGFGSKLLLTNLINTLYRNLYAIIIGKKYTSAELGCYTRADQFATFPSNNIATIILRVTYPVLSKIQDDNEALKVAYRKIIKYSSFIIFPLMIGLLALAEPIIIVVLTEKWAFVIPMLQILCLDWMLDHISGINLNLLYVKKHSDWALRLEIVKKIIAITILFITIPFGLIMMCWGRVLYSVIATIINSFYTEKLINLSIGRQLLDLLPYLIASIIMGLSIIFVSWLTDVLFNVQPIVKVVEGLIVGGVVYGLFSMYFFKGILTDIYSFYHSKIHN